MQPVRALVFDVFGTLVDWRTGVAHAAQTQLAPLGYQLDWLAFADAWRDQYQPAMEEVRCGKLPFSKLDVLHRRNLEAIVPRFGLQALPEPARAQLNLAWHQLPAWPGVSEGLARLRAKYLLAPCSNGNISLMANLARFNGWHWDAILGAEIAGDYKSKLAVYRAAAAAFDLPQQQVMMVAAHSSDLAAAAQAGLATGFVAQVDEYGPNTGEALPGTTVDVAAKSFSEFAHLMLR
jgi:2-haloacid dehalogenase